MASNKVAAANLKVIVFLGTVREGRLGERVATFMKKYLEKTDHDVEVFDPKDMDLPLLVKPCHFYKDNTAPQNLQEAAKKILEADAFVVVTGEYNHSIPPALSNLMDYFGSSCYSWKPSGIVSYSPGIYGGMRAAMQLRSFLGELGCLSVSNIFGIPQVHKALDVEGNALNDHMEKGAKTMVTQLDWHAHAMRNHRQLVGIPK